MSTKTTIFSIGAEKKHSVVYEGSKDGIATSIYILKSALPKPFPQRIKMTMEVVE